MKNIFLFFAILGIMAVNSVQGQVTTVASGNCGAQGNNLTWVLTSDNVLIISGNGAMPDYTWNGSPWYASRNAIKAIVIGDSVTNIGIYAFSWCSNLDSVTIPNNITSIGNSAFYNCSRLKTVYFNAINCTTMGAPLEPVFRDCSSLSTLNIGNQVKIIPNYAFQECRSLTSVTIGNSVTSIGNIAFYECERLNSITIPNSVKTIGNQTFQYCNSLVSVTIGDSVTSIGFNAFMYCHALTSITIPNSVTSIGNYAFAATGLISIIIIATNPPILGNNAFATAPPTIPIYIPCLTDSIYRNASGWSNFTNFAISGSDTTFYKVVSCSIPYTDNNFTTPIYHSGIYYTTLINSTGCDSVLCLTLESVSITNYSKNIFQGCSYNDNNFTNLTQTDTYYDTLQSIYGCDSIICLTLTVNPNPNPNGTTGSLTWTLDLCDSIFTISGSGAMANYSSSPQLPWFSYRSYIKTVIVGDSVTNIGALTFAGCSNLDSVTIPNSVKYIETYAFSSTNLTSISIPSSVTSIGDLAFSSCIRLGSVRIGNGVTTIGSSAFSNCSNLTSITIPNSVTSIGMSAFAGSGLISITIPNSVTSIGVWAFMNCVSLTSVTIGDSVASIIERTFQGCSNLTSVTIGNNVANIGWNAFDGCSSLHTVNYNAINCTGYSLNYCDALTTVNIGNKVKIINDIFQDCSSLKSVMIGDSVTSIGNNAFSGCSGIDSITIPNSVTNIGNEAFNGCSSLTFVTIPNNVTNIGNSAFQNCSSLTSITIPNSVTSIGNSVFNRCISLNSVTIPNSITSIGNYAFNGCNSLSSVTIPNSVTSIGNYAFQSSGSLDSVIIPNSVTSIGAYAFQNCNNLAFVTIGDSVTSIGNNAFSNCTNLHTVNYNAINASIGSSLFSGCSAFTLNIGNTVPSLPNSAFSGCTSLSVLTIGNSVASIGIYAFQNCTNLRTLNYNAINCASMSNASNTHQFAGCNALDTINVGNAVQNIPDGFLWPYGSITTLTIGNSVKTIGSNAFNGCSNLSTVIFGDSITNIGGGAFSGCKSLDSVILPNSLTSIGNSAFENCSSLTSINIPDSVIDVGKGAFANGTSLHTINYDAINCTAMGGSGFFGWECVFVACSAITTVNIGNTVQNIPDYAFYGFGNLTSITIPNSVTNIGQYAFSGCGLTSITIPSNVTNIGRSAFDGCGNLTSITSRAIIPPALGLYTFFRINGNIPVYIPCGTYNSYRTASRWNSFTNYHTLSADSILYNVVTCSVPYTDNNFTTPIYYSGTYYAVLTNNAGCDSIICLTLSEYPYVPITNYSDTICQGSIYTDNNFTNLTQTGIYYDTLQNINGCDSIVCLSLIVKSISVTNYSATICQGSFYTDNNFTNLTQTGIYYDTLQNINGCDSIIELTLNYYQQVPITNYTVSVCQGSPYSDNNFSNLTQTGTYYDTLQNINGCDSIICLNLFVDTVPITNYAVNICEGTIYNDNNFQNLTQVGTYFDTLQNINGCDSIIELTLNYYQQVPITNYAVSICEGTIYNNNNFQNLTKVGTYYDTLQNINGCDSIIELTLDYYPQIPITYYSASFYIGNPYSDANFQNLTQAGIYYDTLPNVNGCDSVLCLTLIGLNASISGTIIRQDLTPLDAGLVELYEVQNGGQYILSDAISVSNNGSYTFTDVSNGNYVVKFIPDSSENALPTYYGNTELWNLATLVSITNNLPSDSVDITLIPLNSLNGNSLISGYVGQDNSGEKSLSQKSVSNPAEDVHVYLQQEEIGGWQTVAQTRTDLEGYFEFRNVPAGKYKVILDAAGLTTDNPEIMAINDRDTVQNIVYEITENGIENKSGNVDIVEANGYSPVLRVYPNPTNGQLHIECKDVARNVSTADIQIYNVMGQLLQSKIVNLQSEITIDVSHLANGVYYLKIGEKTARFVKE